MNRKGKVHVQEAQMTIKNVKMYLTEIGYRLCVISGLRREVDENSALRGHYAAGSGNFLPTFRDNLSVPSSGVNNSEDGTVRLSRSVGKKLPLLAA
jgi:hypothetical protein